MNNSNNIGNKNDISKNLQQIRQIKTIILKLKMITFEKIFYYSFPCFFPKKRDDSSHSAVTTSTTPSCR
jgi:hypothetical protein